MVEGSDECGHARELDGTVTGGIIEPRVRDSDRVEVHLARAMMSA
jgi:hypothetical protein